LVCGASKGLGLACAHALALEGVNVTLVARSEGPLSQAADAIAKLECGDVGYVAADITTEAGRTAVLTACREPDILVTNAGGPPPGNFRDWSLDDWQKAINANMLSAIELMRLTIDCMIGRRFGRIVNITSS